MPADALDELLEETLSFFDEADTLLFPLIFALPEPLTLVLLTNFFVLLMVAVVDAVSFAFLALSAALADESFFAVEERVLLAVEFTLFVLALNMAFPLAVLELVKLALLL